MSWLFGQVEKQQDKVNFKIYDDTTWGMNNCKTQLPNISRSKGNLTMKFGQLIEKHGKHFSWKTIHKCAGETIPRPFSQKFYTVCFNCMPGWKQSKYIETKL